MKKRCLQFGFPTGTIKEQSLQLFSLAGYDVRFDEEFQKVTLDDPEINCLATRVIEIAPLVAQGILDAGITTHISIEETGAKVVILQDLAYHHYLLGRASLMLMVPERSDIRTLRDLAGKTIITRFPNIAKTFLKKNRIKSHIFFSDMTVIESKVGLTGDAVLEVTSHESQFREYGLKPLVVLGESSAIFVANAAAMKSKRKRQKIEELKYMLAGARMAQEYIGVMLHTQGNVLKEALSLLPALKAPTVTRLQGNDAFDILTVAKKQEMRLLIPRLKKIGCTDIVEFPVSKVIL